jgi:hypothetical protein
MALPADKLHELQNVFKGLQEKSFGFARRWLSIWRGGVVV